VLLLPLLMVLLAETAVCGTGLVMRMFSGFTSRCTTPFSWQWRRASSTCLHPGRQAQEMGGLCLHLRTQDLTGSVQVVTKELQVRDAQPVPMLPSVWRV